MWVHIFREIDRGTIEIGQILAVQSALPDFNKNQSVGLSIHPENDKGRLEKTDHNRNSATGSFMKGGDSGWKADWIFWIDDDTVFPDGAISKLLRMDKPFCAGLYFNANPPKNPIAYFRKKDGFYEPLWDFAPGSIMPVDSVGMGCTLIHRSVYEKIVEEHVVFQRPTGSLFAIHKRMRLSW